MKAVHIGKSTSVIQQSKSEILANLDKLKVEINDRKAASQNNTNHQYVPKSPSPVQSPEDNESNQSQIEEEEQEQTKEV